MTAGRRPELERRRAEREPRQAANRSAAAAGVAFAVPQTRAQASREIGRLKTRRRSTRTEPACSPGGAGGEAGSSGADGLGCGLAGDTGGGAATSTAGGAGGVPGRGPDGLGTGGSAGTGGAGGGLYGGGSNLVPPGGTSALRTDPAQLTISYQAPAAPADLALTNTGSPNPVLSGQRLT